ncbi:unnamed protein product [Bursaphelenchus xylophilus]|uniref:(pine wood nematode) hypothetical protein n=1 Tax=Bursaphelenchus xylophilus TaxID=6326 RepID=A0A1I7S604_BURXY|nr:unnamed protein product [Bursaphelenchus xylophilus]CAG9082434.1 unnamed protein product [Bursaphelenchus xylophilus]
MAVFLLSIFVLTFLLLQCFKRRFDPKQIVGLIPENTDLVEFIANLKNKRVENPRLCYETFADYDFPIYDDCLFEPTIEQEGFTPSIPQAVLQYAKKDEVVNWQQNTTSMSSPLSLTADGDCHEEEDKYMVDIWKALSEVNDEKETIGVLEKYGIGFDGNVLAAEDDDRTAEDTKLLDWGRKEELNIVNTPNKAETEVEIDPEKSYVVMSKAKYRITDGWNQPKDKQYLFKP